MAPDLTKVKKRDGTKTDFDQSRITKAIFAAAKEVGGKDKEKAKELSNKITQILDQLYSDRNPPTVEDIQNLVEKVLIEEGHAQTAKAYVLYRKQHEDIREVSQMIDRPALVEDYLNREDWRVRENANMSYSLQGLNNYITEQVVKGYWLKSIYPKSIRKAHEEAQFHIHDLGVLGPYCVGWDMKDLLNVGFKGVRGKIESKPAKHFRTALGQLVNFLYTLQGEAAGAQAVSNFDTLLAPFIAHDGLSREEAKQAMQEFLYNINVPTRVGFQAPFTNVTMDLEVPSYMQNEQVIIGGEAKGETFGDYQEETYLVNEIFSEIMMEGDAKGRPFTFPIPTYNITEDFKWDDERLDPLWEMTAKYGTPYFANFINSDMQPDDARSMCCRLRLDKRELKKRGGGLFGSNPLTGSIGVVTINLPRIGYETNDEDKFIETLNKRMDVAKKSLGIKRKVLEKFTEKGLFPYSKFYLREIKEGFDEYWKNHFSTIGINGMNDALLNFMDQSIASEEGRKFALKVMDHMRKKLADYQEETGNIFNLEATPAEGTSYRLARLDKKKYPDIKIYNQKKYGGDEPYYTNSTQLPVGYTNDIFRALDLQDKLQSQYTGGTVLHGFIGEKMPSKESTKKLVKRIAENYELPYFTITPTFSICPKHGYIPGEHEYCPKCDAEIGYTGRDIKEAKQND